LRLGTVRGKILQFVFTVGLSGNISPPSKGYKGGKMANNYTEFSEMIPCKSKEQQDWLMRELAEAVKDDDGAMYPPCEFTPDGKDVWVYAEDSGDLDVLADVVATFQNVFGVEEPWTLTWAGTCSKPRLGNFGGGGLVAYRGKVSWQDAWDWCAAEVQRLQA